MPTSGIRLADYLRLVRENRNFRLLWGAQVISEIGDWFYSVAIFSFLLEVAGTAQSVAMAFTLQVLPQVIAAPFAGVVNDRFSRRKVMLFADWSRAVIVALMLLVRSRDAIWLLFALLILETIMWALFEPARTAVVPNIVEGRDIAAANALQSTTWSFNFAIGSALGGIVAAIWGRDSVFVINSLSFVVSALLIRRMVFHEPHTANPSPGFPIGEAVAYVRRNSRLSATLFVKAGLSLMGANWVLLPVMGEKLFPVHLPGFDSRQAATMGMSVLLGSRGFGAIIGSFIAAAYAGTVSSRLRFTVLIGFVMGGLGYLALAGAPTVWLACAALILAHAGGSIIWTSSTTLMQEMTDDRYRGRVFSAEFAFSMFTLAAMSQLAGYLIDHHVALRTVAFLTGIFFFVPAIVWASLQRLWRHS